MEESAKAWAKRKITLSFVKLVVVRIHIFELEEFVGYIRQGGIKRNKLLLQAFIKELYKDMPFKKPNKQLTNRGSYRKLEEKR